MSEVSSFGATPERDGINQTVVEIGHVEAARLRGHVIGAAHQIVKKFQEADFETMALVESSGFPDEANVEFYVMTDNLVAPPESPEFTECLSVLLMHDPDLYPENDDRIRLHVPVPDYYDTTDPEAELPVPEEVYVEFETRIDGEMQHRRYSISKDKIFEYELEVDTGDDITYDDLSDRVIWNMLSKRLSTNLPFLGQLLEDLANLHVVHQRAITIGDRDVSDR